MKSFIKTDKELKIPGGAVVLMNSISEFKVKQELYTKQPTLREKGDPPSLKLRRTKEEIIMKSLDIDFLTPGMAPKLMLEWHR